MYPIMFLTGFYVSRSNPEFVSWPRSPNPLLSCIVDSRPSIAPPQIAGHKGHIVNLQASIENRGQRGKVHCIVTAT